METHYLKHHAAYTKNFNTLTKEAGIDNKPVEVILAHWKNKSEGKSDAQGIRNNGGGYFNHNLFFGQFSDTPAHEPTGEFANKINTAFGSLDSLKESLTKLATGQFGSGWAFLSADEEGKLYATKAANQNNPFMEEGKHTPILGIDVWEHAYYLKYKNLRGDYVKNFFEVLDWEKVSENYENRK